MGERTVSFVDDPARRDEDGRHERLVLVLDASCPLEEPISVSLADIDEVVLGRGDTRRIIADGRRRLRVELADGRPSRSR